MPRGKKKAVVAAPVVPARKQTKNEKRRARKKESHVEKSKDSIHDLSNKGMDEEKTSVEIEYVSANYEDSAEIDEELFAQFKDVFNKFSKPEELVSTTETSENTENNKLTENTGHKGDDDANAGAISDSLEELKLSKKKKKLMNRLSVAELKQLVSRPDLVEIHDVTSSDPRLLVHLKSYRNTVQVPRHWCFIRKYLQGKRGVEKLPFQLPEFIAETGIAKIRESVLEQEALKKSKQKARERVKPKMGKIDIDYQVLHDAFFKYQTKPKLSIHGDLYYEGKELEVNLKEKQPGRLSSDLKEALGMQEGSPPPWLINMQRYGPPPSYSALRIPGLNAPLPPGASYGYQPGGWGKPPVDEYGRPLYGDVFGTTETDEVDGGAEVDKSVKWGSLEEQYYSEEESEDEEEEEEEQKPTKRPRDKSDASGLETPNTLEGIASTITSGTETPSDVAIDLRKRSGLDTPSSAAPKDLYQIIQEKQTSGSAAQLFGSDRTYVLPGKGDVQISINPDELEETLKDQEKLKDTHEMLQQQQSELGQRAYGFSTNDGAETEGTMGRTTKKRRVESSAVKKIKEFKF